MFLPALVDKGVKFASAASSGSFFCCSRCPLDVIYGYGRYSEMSFSVKPGYFAKDPSLIARSRVRLFGKKRI